jgi:hypothetical protein
MCQSGDANQPLEQTGASDMKLCVPKTHHHGTELAPSLSVKIMDAKLCTSGYTATDKKKANR